MATVTRFEDLEVWKKSRELDRIVFKLTGKGNFTKEEFDEVYNYCTEISKMLQGLMSYLQNSDIKGTKYKVNTH